MDRGDIIDVHLSWGRRPTHLRLQTSSREHNAVAGRDDYAEASCVRSP